MGVAQFASPKMHVAMQCEYAIYEDHSHNQVVFRDLYGGRVGQNIDKCIAQEHCRFW